MLGRDRRDPRRVEELDAVAATVAALKVYLGVDPASTIDLEAMGAAVAAANDLVQTFRPDLTLEAGVPLEVWPPRCDQAALVEAARLYGRRGSVQGIAAFADVGVSMLPRLDPEVRSLLELGEYQRNVVA
jgi:hypothetical protein